MTTHDGTVGRYLHWLLVAFSLGAGVIHFAYSGEHFDVAWSHGAFFAAVAWLQLSWAVALIVRPTRRVLALGAGGNAAVIGVWATSRLWGVPVGPDAWSPEPVALADALATGLEAGIVVVSLAVLLRPALAQLSLRPSLGLAGLGATGLAVAVVSTMALAPAFASGHDHGEADEGGAAYEHDDDGGDTAGAHDHDEGDADGTAEGHEGHTNVVISADGTSACERSGYGNEGNSGHGHRGPVPFTAVDAATRARLADEIEQSNAVAAKYPTVADAEAGGWRRITPYVPCIAAHYLNNTLLDGNFDPANPEILLFDGTDPDSQLVGLSYLQFADPDTPPDGFAGGNDPWHVHTQLCLGGGGVVGDESTTEEECASRGGSLVRLDNLWMMHMWNVPGWESRWGLFSSEHPDLGGVIGDINAEPESG
ncbi:MAG TPA: hypothetical protein VE575_05505 [Acidimicrobiales bacterium]|jgi:hypothetical protein|nr:hypothetical protein [Acidimicrobiales bacterium]